MIEGNKPWSRFKLIICCKKQFKALSLKALSAFSVVLCCCLASHLETLLLALLLTLLQLLSSLA